MMIQTPDWVKHAVFYQIFPDRFARTQSPRHRPEMAVPLEPWTARPTPQGYKGGELWGVAEQLDYLQDLGVTALYFTPIFQSASNHRYHTHDYYQVDPLLGGNDAFQDLLTAAHQRQMRVVLDGVFNHASRGFFYFNDILENGPASPWLDWFQVEAWPLSAYDGDYPANYRSWVNNRALPQFNHANPAAREYLMRVGEHWVRQGIDGWRLDVPFEVKAEGFWQEFRQRIKAINPEAYIVGEVWRNAQEWLDGSQFDGVMNYLFTGPTLAFTGGDRVRMDYAEEPDYYPYPALDAAGYGQKIKALLDLYPWEIQLAQLNLLSSHDIARALSVMGDDQTSLELAVLLQMTFPGAPSIYYGDEVGLRGGLDPDCRWALPPRSEWNLELWQHHRDLIALRHDQPALRLGDYRILATVDHAYCFARCLTDSAMAPLDRSSTIVVAVNTGDQVAQLTPQQVPPSLGDPQVLYGAGSLDSGAGQGRWTLTLPPRTGIILG
ncbi:glycoside hydrolase family 13 protein [Leptolyngbya sp. PCC 6406]|uniref:glycoside hydrolase family 13 protein n=1 Tax=Leptolyngbya sp. PCC 6406 TaxID=1173264 RepID=UPI0002AC4BD7|nr:glycoside hydrolase family 13 protein [Leptolyngbya sp. PCC 6406]